MPRCTRTTARLAALMAMAVLAGACSSSGSSSSAGGTSATTTVPHGAGVAAVTVQGPITTGKGTATLIPDSLDLFAMVGYEEQEFFVSGDATSYRRRRSPRFRRHVGGHPELDPAPDTTRIVVRLLVDPARFDGTVFVEWLNVWVVSTPPPTGPTPTWS